MVRELTLEPTYFLNTDYRFHFIVLGCGGNGSELVPKICRQLSFKRSSLGAQIHDITVVDKDVVEEKNLLRQNFFKGDLGKNKAEVMGLKCSTVFNMVVRAFNMFVETPGDLSTVINASDKIPFIIGCVDTNAVRKMLHQFVKGWRKRTPVFWLDAGNEEFAGQVVLGCKLHCGSKLNQVAKVTEGDGEDKITYTTYNFNLPTVCDLYPDMLKSEDRFASAISCAERAVSNPQAADTNVEAANILYQFVSNCLRGRINYHKVTFNVLQGNRATVHNDESVLKSYKIDTDIEVINCSEDMERTDFSFQ
jgi:PRTRC genetic system ThiF family protein